VSTRPEKTAIVLAGGGSLGALQLGMLAEILEAGEYPDFIVGVSAGAIDGAELIARARDSTRAWARSGGLGHTEFPTPLKIHSH
jgi:predicted acylesterase/phospholipase RssA